MGEAAMAQAMAPVMTVGGEVEMVEVMTLAATSSGEVVMAELMTSARGRSRPGVEAWSREHAMTADTSWGSAGERVSQAVWCLRARTGDA